MTTPVSAIGVSYRSDDWCDRWFTNAPRLGQTLANGLSVDFGLSSFAYSQPQYQDDGRRVKVWPRPDVSGPFPSTPYIMAIPKDAIPSSGNDEQFDVHTAKGVYSVWGYIGPGQKSFRDVLNRAQAQIYNLLRGANMAKDGCAWGVGFAPADEKGNASIQAPAVHLYPGTATPDEITAGVIEHCLTFSVDRRCSMGGKPAPRTILDIDDPAIGTTQAASAAPARFLETQGAAFDKTGKRIYPLSGQVPDGMRLAIRITDAEINTWLDSRKFTGPLRNTARVFAQCLRDYGMIQAQTGGASIIPVDGSPQAQVKWKQLGVTPSTDLLSGLVTRDRMVALRPPVATYKDGTTGTREGLATSVSY